MFKPFRYVANYLRESWKEVGRVTWPSRQTATRLTIVVLVFTAFFTVLSGVADFGLERGIRRVLDFNTAESTEQTPTDNVIEVGEEEINPDAAQENAEPELDQGESQ